MKTKFFQTKLMLLVAMLIGGANMAFGQTDVDAALNALTESTGEGGYGSFWQWKKETYSNYNKYNILQVLNNNIYAIPSNPTDGATLFNVTSNGFLNKVPFIFYKKRTEFKTTITGSKYNSDVFDPVICGRDGDFWSGRLDLSVSNNNFHQMSYGSYVRINGTKLQWGSSNSNNQWTFYSEKQVECLNKLIEARKFVTDNFTPEEQQDIDDIKKFLTPLSNQKFSGSTAAERQAVDIAIAKMHYWYNTLHGYGDGVPYTMKYGIQGADGHDRVAKNGTYDCIEGWSGAANTDQGLDPSTSICWTSSSASPNGYPGTDPNNPFYDIRNLHLTQTITGLPNGVYKFSVNWQMGRDEGTTHGAKLKFKTTASNEWTSTEYFDSNYSGWQTTTSGEMTVVDGNLKIEIWGNTGADKNGWINIDNLQLTYLYKYKDTTVDKTKTITTGVIDANDSSFGLATTDAQPWLEIDNNNVTIVGNDVTFNAVGRNDRNPNGICYVASGTNISGDNVVKGNTCSKLHLYDAHPYRNKKGFTANEATYNMEKFGEGIIGKSATSAGTTARLGTLMLPYAVSDISENVTLYKATINGTKVTLSKVNGGIAENTPYIVRYKLGVPIAFTPTANGVTINEETGGLLYGDANLVGAYQLTPVPSDGSCYLLQKHDPYLSFYKVNSSGINVGPLRVYLDSRQTASAKEQLEVVFDDDTPSGIEEVEAANGDDEIYDITGRRVERIKQSGIYIKNGKKILVK